jgi:hypothetical protein
VEAGGTLSVSVKALDEREEILGSEVDERLRGIRGCLGGAVDGPLDIWTVIYSSQMPVGL